MIKVESLNNDIKTISKERSYEIINNRDLPENKGKFIIKDDNVWVAIDNTTNDAWTEEFSSEEDAIKWLNNKELTPEDLGEDFSNKSKILMEDNAIKITLKQNVDFEFDPSEQEAGLDAYEIIDSISDIDNTKLTDNLLKYLKNYNFDDEFREVYNAVRKATVDLDYDTCTVILELGHNFEDDILQEVFEDFISEVVLEDDNLSGFTTVTSYFSHDEEDDEGRTIDIYDGEEEHEIYYKLIAKGEQSIEITKNNEQ